MKKVAFIERMKYLNQDAKENITVALQEQKRIEESYQNKREGQLEGEYFLSAVAGPHAYEYMDRTFIELLANTYVEREKIEAYMERSFLLNSNVLKAGSLYAKAIIGIVHAKPQEERQNAYHTYGSETTIRDFRSCFVDETRETELVRPYQKSKKSTN